MIVIRMIVAVQDGSQKSSAFMAGPNTFYCVNPENPNDHCVGTSAWHQFVYYTFGVQTTVTSVRLLPDGPGDGILPTGGGFNNPYSPKSVIISCRKPSVRKVFCYNVGIK